MFMENLRLEHFKLAGFKLHTCNTINSKENACMKSEEIMHCVKNQVCQLQWKNEHFFLHD